MSSSKLSAVVIIVSETAAQDPSTDKGGPLLRDAFQNEGTGQWEVVSVEIVPDDAERIQEVIKKWTDREQPVNVLVTSGGTGFAAKDITPEAVTPLLDKQAPGLVHGMLSASLAITPFAVMSRPVAGVRRQTIILTLPGSPKGAQENLQSVLKLLSHACVQAAGANSRAIHAGGVKKLEKEHGVSSDTTSVAASSQTKGDTRSHHHHHHHHHHGQGHAGPIAHTSAADHPKSNDPNDGPTRRHRSSPYPMVSVEDALEFIAGNTPALKVIKKHVNGALVGSVLAEDVRAAENVPAFRASIVDGYAVVVGNDAPSIKGTFPVTIVSHAKPGEVQTLQPGQIARITTGAPLPPGATSVVMVEDTILKSRTEDGKEEKEVEILTDKVKPGENVREVGSDVLQGDIILRKGEGITATGGELGLLGSVGVAEVPVYNKPVVGVLSTGDEIIQHDRPGPLKLGEVRDTNRLTLLTAIHGCGFEAVDLGIASDQPGKLEETIRSAFRQVDVIVTSGGVSMGELDLLKPTIERALGGTIHFGRVAMKPGKPTTFATIPVKDNDGNRVNKLIFSLPGNPASCVVTFHLFVLPSLHQASGISPKGLPKAKVVLAQDIKLDPQRLEYHRAVVSIKSDGRLYAISTGGQRSSRIGSFRGANALLCMPPGAGVVPKGQQVDALLMGRILSDFEIAE